MNFLKRCGALAAAFWLSFSPAFAQVPPAEQLLPEDTLGVVTIPDWKKTADLSQSTWLQLWMDPAMKPFRENFSSNFQSDLIEPLEKQLGIKLADYKELVQGQVTVAVAAPAEGAEGFGELLFLLDAKDKSELLATKLSELGKKWADAGKTVKTEKIRDVEFQVISVSKTDWRGLWPGSGAGEEEEDEDGDDADQDDAAAKEEKKAEGDAPAGQTQLRIGQWKSLLIAGENAKAIEKVLARQSGGLVPPLAELPAYQTAHTALFRDSIGHGWVNLKPIISKLLASAGEGGDAGGMPGMNLQKVFPALGLGGLSSMASSGGAGPEGAWGQFLLAVPETQREGIFKIFALEKKDASPPPFVPADAIQFRRTRLDARKAWDGIEALLAKIDPGLAGLAQMMISTAGKDKDPNFDLKKSLIANLGDDFIQYQKGPKSSKLEDLASPPTLILLGSPNAAQLIDAIRLIATLLPPPLSSAPLQEREFLGKKIYSLPMGLTGAVDEAEAGQEPNAAKPQNLSFTASGGYVAFSADNSILEEYLRSAENPPKPLRATPGLAEAAQKAGGMENGFFNYANDSETIRLTLETIKKDPEGIQQMMFFSLSRGGEEGAGLFERLFNLKLLPDFEKIAKYFSFTVSSAGSTPEGYLVRTFSPAPRRN